jgi:predicted O-methyltransferase YrrM
VKLPETFGLDDCRKAFGGEFTHLLINSGMLLVDLNFPRVEELYFTMSDWIERVNGRLTARVFSEDWFFSKLAADLGAKLMATRKIKVDHIGNAAYPNYGDWGMPTDYESVDLVAYPGESRDNIKIAIEAVKRGAMQKTEELSEFLDFLSNYKLKTVVEIGTAKGGTLWAFSQIAQPDARLIAIDKNPEISMPMESYKRNGQIAIVLKEDSHSDDAIQQLSHSINGSQIDLLYIDGDHSYEGVKEDFKKYSHLVAAGGLIAFHDVFSKMEAPGVRRFWAELRESSDVIEFRDPRGGSDECGIGVIIK